ncbi:MAG: sulfate ABC transporter permease subunit CysW [Bryobacterales bacterium]|nr:sulfate ABC transporter permease subunit CysW [Bryobacterales bacterium]
MMAEPVAGVTSTRRYTEPPLVRAVLLTIALGFLLLFLGLPLLAVFQEAFRQGWRVYTESFLDPAALAAIRLTLLVTAIAVPVNALFGIGAAWLLARFSFRGKSVLLTLVDLPFSISPVVVGLMLVLLFGSQSLFGGWLRESNIQVLFAVPGIVLATLFVTFPFIARELIPLLQQQGSEEEEAAILLGANGWQMFWRVTLPNIRWGLLYGVVLSVARAMGEFGAVSVVSGHIRGATNTIPLHVEILYNDYQFSSAFAVASLLALLALLSLLLKAWLEWRIARDQLARAEAAGVAGSLRATQPGGLS